MVCIYGPFPINFKYVLTNAIRMATANFAFIVFLALKNTPLAFLTNYSYERINFLHRVAGYTTVLFMLLHTAAYIRHEVTKNKIEKLIEIDNVCGVIAGCAMLAIAITALLFMKRTYELFYIAHISLFMVATVGTGLHRPEWIDRIPIVMIMIAVAWTLDRLTRLTCMMARSINNEARLESLPSGGTKVILKKSLKNAAPGTHWFYGSLEHNSLRLTRSPLCPMVLMGSNWWQKHMMVSPSP
jgi:hypothetical protein